MFSVAEVVRVTMRRGRLRWFGHFEPKCGGDCRNEEVVVRRVEAERLGGRV